MKIRGRSCCAIASAVTAMLGGCGGSQPPIGAPGAMPQMASKWLDAVRSSKPYSRCRRAGVVYASNSGAGGSL